MSAKTDLRRALRARRSAHPGGAIRVPDAFLARLAPGVTVAAYMPVGGEADPAPLVRAAFEAGCVLALPHVVDREAPLRFLDWATGATLAEGPFGLRQPPPHAAERMPDIILTPLLGFDAAGHRLGQGAGHYDRAFAAHPSAWRIGIAWEVQRVEHLQPDPWDVRLHAIVTEKNWIVP